MRYLLTVGGAGAQQELFAQVIEHLIPKIEAGRAVLMVNVADHEDVWEGLRAAVPALSEPVCHFNDFDATALAG